MVKIMANQIRVLHVDDEPGFASMTGEFLERVDDRISTVAVTAVSAGLEHLEEEEFDCIVSDYEMPGQTGIEFLKEIRASNPDLPFILYTGKGSEEIAADAISAGVTDYLQKGRGTGQYDVLANRITNLVANYRTTQQLEESQQRLSLFFEQSPLGVIEWDDEFNFHRMNEAAESILGYDASELEGRAWEVIVPPEDMDAVGQVVDELLDAQGGYHSINENIRPDGERIVCEWHNRVVTDDDGETVAIFSQFQDITDRKEHEHLLEEHSSLIQAARDAVIFINEDGTIHSVNPAVEDIFGYKPHELAGESLAILMPDNVAEEHTTALERYLETGERTIDWDYAESTGLRKDGTRIDVASSYTEIEHADERRFVGIVRDITHRKAREEQLARVKERFQAFVENSSDIVTVLDENGIIQYESPAVERILGYEQDELVGEPAMEYIHPDDREAVMQTFYETIDEKELVHDYEEFRFKHAGGSWVWLQAVGSNRLEETTGGFVINSRDITGWKEREHELRERVKELSAIREATTLFGSHEATFDELLAEFITTLPESFQYPTDTEVQITHGDEMVSTEGFEHTEPHLSATSTMQDGREVLLEAVILDEERTFLDEEQALIETLVRIIQSHLERMDYIRELERYQALVEASGDPMYLLDSEGCFTFVNEAMVELTGFDQAALVGESGMMVMDEEDYERGSSLIRSLLEGEQDRGTFEMDLHTAAGDVIPCENHVALMFDEETFTGTAGVIRDISDMLDREEALRRQNDRLDRFSSIVSHDLRNPLNVAAGRIQLVDEECNSEHIEHVVAALDRMEVLIEDTLTLARDGQTVAESEPIALGELSRQCWNIVTSETAILEVDTGLVIQGDKDRVRQIIENVFRNAVEHSDTSVTVRIGTLDDGFFIEDNGPGIPAGEREAVFEPGYSTSDQGTGFGLSIAKEIAEAHGWSVSLTQAESGGARFEFTGVEIVPAG